MSGPADPFPLAHLDVTAGSGVSEAQARAIWRVVAEARAGRLDPDAAHGELVAGGYTDPEAEALVEEVLERLARRADRAS
jgi:hypothetical protein